MKSNENNALNKYVFLFLLNMILIKTKNELLDYFTYNSIA
jgi:hypothetical protein